MLVYGGDNGGGLVLPQLLCGWMVGGACGNPSTFAGGLDGRVCVC